MWTRYATGQCQKTLQEIKLESEKDILLQALMKAVQTDQWTHPEVQEYRNVKDELLVHQGTLLRGNRIVVPKALGDRAVDLAPGTKETRKQHASSEKKFGFPV